MNHPVGPREGVSIVDPDYKLKKKIGENIDLNTIFTPAKVEAARRAADSSRLEFLYDIKHRLEEAEKAYNSRQEGDDTMIILLDHIFAIKSNAGIANYLLASAISKSLYVFLENKKAIKNADEAVIESHLDALKGVFANKIEGDGGELGKELLESLQQVIDKYASNNPKF